MFVIFPFFSKIRTREPGPVLGNLDLNRSLVGEPYSVTWIRAWEPGPVHGNFEFDPYSFMCSGSRDRETKKPPRFLGFLQ